MLARPPSESHLRVLESLDFENSWPLCSPPTTIRKGRKRGRGKETGTRLVLHPPARQVPEPLPISKTWVEWRLKDAAWVATARPLAKPELVHEVPERTTLRLANRQDNAAGESSKNASKASRSSTTNRSWPTCTYIDLNPVAAGIAKWSRKRAPIRRSQRESTT